MVPAALLTPTPSARPLGSSVKWDSDTAYDAVVSIMNELRYHGSTIKPYTWCVRLVSATPGHSRTEGALSGHRTRVYRSKSASPLLKPGPAPCQFSWALPPAHRR